MGSESHIQHLTVEGYRFCRSDNVPFDLSVMTAVPPSPTTTNTPYAVVYKPVSSKQSDGEEADCYHVCTKEPHTRGEFVLAHRCNPTWNGLSDQQKDVIEKIEDEVNACRRNDIHFRSVILDGLGGCGKTRLMAYVMNHSPDNTHVMYLTKQNKRLQDFLYDELTQHELIEPQPVLDMSKSSAIEFGTLRSRPEGRYACSVEKLVYNVSGNRAARQTNLRKALQWKMEIPDRLFEGYALKTSKRNAVVLLDEYTMISPALLHKTVHCIQTLFGAPTVLIMGGDRFQLGPINWDERSDRCLKGTQGEEAPQNAVTQNNWYYTSDVREELASRTGRKPYEYQMVGSQRCRNDPQLAKLVLYLRNACEKKTSVKAIERRLVAFGRSHDISLFHCETTRSGCKAGRLVFKKDSIEDTGTDDDSDEDRHLGDDDRRDTAVIDVDWSSPPTVDMTPFVDFYTDLYEQIYLDNVSGRMDKASLPVFVYEKASAFVRDAFPIFMVKKNDKCNILSDTFLKTLYNGVYTNLVAKYDCSEPDAKRPRPSEPNRLKSLLKNLCVSISISDNCPVQQTLMVGVPYRITDTLKSLSMPVVSNGELVLLTAIRFDTQGAIKYVTLKTLQRNTDHFLLVRPGVTWNRLNKETGGRSVDDKSRVVVMLPMVPLVCENIYQMQGNTIVSNCFVDLLSTKRDDIYVAVSRFQNTSSIKGIVFSQ